MSAALAEYRQRYRAARARLWGGGYVELVERRPVAIPAMIYDAPVGPRRPLLSETVVRSTTRAIAFRVARETAEKHGFTLDDLTSMRRSKELCQARNEAFFRLRTVTGWSTSRIGQFFGDRDHSTIISGMRKHQMLEAGR